MSALLPCECGGDPTRWSTDIDGLICRIICRSCGAQTTIFGDWPSAEQSWNRRAPPPLPTREEVARAMNSVAYADHEAKWATDQWPTFLPAADAVLRLLGGEKTDA